MFKFVRKSVILSFCLVLCAFYAQAGWQRQNSRTFAWLHSVYFLDQNRGWAVGASGALLSTVDSGQTWTTEPRPTEDNLRDVFFSDADNGWIVCERPIVKLKALESRSYFLRTTDAGKTWNKIEIRENRDNAQINRLIAPDKSSVWALGEIGTLFNFDGSSWRRLELPTRFRLQDATFFNQRQGLLVSAGRTLLTTSNGGRTWNETRLNVQPDARLNAVFFASRTNGWIVGDRGTILATSNSGRTWQAQRSNAAYDLLDVHFAGQIKGWAIGDAGTLLHTVDGGVNWQPLKSGTGHRLERLFFVDQNRGWAVGFGGTILSFTEDAARPPFVADKTVAPPTNRSVNQKKPTARSVQSHRKPDNPRRTPAPPKRTNEAPSASKPPTGATPNSKAVLP